VASSAKPSSVCLTEGSSSAVAHRLHHPRADGAVAAVGGVGSAVGVAGGALRGRGRGCEERG